MHWHQTSNHRQMPWKGEKDAYKIWLSEIILQQTRVEQGWAYYEKFITQFPTIFDLAKAKEEKVFKLWEGLGYYNRCKNLFIISFLFSIVKSSSINFSTLYCLNSLTELFVMESSTLKTIIVLLYFKEKL